MVAGRATNTKAKTNNTRVEEEEEECVLGAGQSTRPSASLHTNVQELQGHFMSENQINI